MNLIQSCCKIDNSENKQHIADSAQATIFTRHCFCITLVENKKTAQKAVVLLYRIVVEDI